WFSDFQTPLPPSFVVNSGPPSGTFSSTVDGGVLRLFDTKPSAQGGARIGTGIETSVVFADVRLTGTLNPAGTTANLVNLTRGNLSGNTYTAGIDFAAGVLKVVKVVSGPVKIVLSTDDSQGNQPPLTDLARSYFLQFDIVGNHLTARVFDVQGGMQLLVVNYTDTGDGGLALASGYAGVSVVSSGGVVDATFGPVGAAAL